MPDGLIVVAAQYLFLVIPIVAFVYWLRVPPAAKKYLVVLGLTVGLGALATGRLIAHFYFDARPFSRHHFTPLIAHEPDNGFPSDHTLLSSAIAATVTACSAPLGACLWIVTAVVGIARIRAGLHTPIDVGGSMVIAGGLAIVAHVLLRRRFASNGCHS